MTVQNIEEKSEVLTVSVCFLNHLLNLSIGESLTQLLRNLLNVCSRYLALNSESISYRLKQTKC